MTFDAESLYKKLKKRDPIYKEELHCPMLLNIMNHPDKGTVSSFCVEALVCERTFYYWVRDHKVFQACYHLGKMMARENWEKEGREIRDKRVPMGTVDHRFEHWKVIGWSRFGVGKTSRVRLDLTKGASPSQHYGEILTQASDGDFTAGEIKQLMEAINVGLNAHQVLELQKQIDELKSDLTKLNDMKDVKNNYTNKGIA